MTRHSCVKHGCYTSVRVAHRRGALGRLVAAAVELASRLRMALAPSPEGWR